MFDKQDIPDVWMPKFNYDENRPFFEYNNTKSNLVFTMVSSINPRGFMVNIFSIQDSECYITFTNYESFVECWKSIILLNNCPVPSLNDFNQMIKVLR